MLTIRKAQSPPLSPNLTPILKKIWLIKIVIIPQPMSRYRK